MVVKATDALRKILTAIKTLKTFSASVICGTNYIKILSIGICWGNGKSRSVNFPITFSSAPIVYLSPMEYIQPGYTIAGGVSSCTTKGFTYVTRYLSSTNSYGEAGESFAWIAIGNIKLGGAIANHHLFGRWCIC